MPARPAARLQLARLDAFADDLGDAWLTDAEASRLQAMTSQQRRRSFLAGHWQARQAASEWLGIDPARIALSTHASGQPLVLVDAEPASLSISISHSAEWLAVAVASQPIGVDLELPRRARDYANLARFTFSPEEAMRLQQLDAADRSAAFHRLWTLLEARGKRNGDGLLTAQTRQLSAIATNPDTAEASTWDLDNGALAVVTSPGTRIELRTEASLSEPMAWRFVSALSLT